VDLVDNMQKMQRMCQLIYIFVEFTYDTKRYWYIVLI